MGNKISKKYHKSKAAQTSVQPKDVEPHQRTNIQMVQNLLLIWLDNNIDDDSADYCNTIVQLRRIVYTIHTYTDGDQCIDFLGKMQHEKACLVISGSLGQHVLPRVHDMSQVDSVFIFCNNKQYHEQWSKEWPKIKGVFTEIAPICEALKAAVQQCEQNSMPMSFMATNDISRKKLDQLEPTFMYTQIMKEILLSIDFKQQHINEFIQHCRDVFAANEHELKNVKKFEKEYRDKTPIWWYTYECFLYPMLNRTLRVLDGDMIVKMGFLIGDLHRHIVQLHQVQFGNHNSNKSFTVYRGQGMSIADFQQMSKTKGGLMSFNNFLSTSKNRTVSLNFANRATTTKEMIGILFDMTIDPTQSTTSFASITSVSYFKDKEDEVLFSMHTVFRIGEITPMSANNSLYTVKLALTTDDDKDLRTLTDHFRQETTPSAEGWYRLGAVLLDMGQTEKAQQVYEILLGQTTTEAEKADIYLQLGRTRHERGEYTQAITYFETALEIHKKNLPPTDPYFATCCNNIGMAYNSMGDYPKALSYYEKALAIREQSLPPNHPDLGATYNNIGIVNENMGDYPKAISSHEQALAIREQSLPPNHPDLGGSYSNIGMVNHNMGDHPKALSYYEKALAIREQSLPPNHPDLAASYDNIGNVYNTMGDYSKALSYHEKALAIQQQSLPPNHPDLGGSYNNIGVVHYNMGDYPKALSSLEQALAIQQQSLVPNHPALAVSYNNIGGVYDSMDDYSKALSYYEKALAIREQSLPPNHPSLGASYNKIGRVNDNMGDYAKALSSHEIALAIREQSLPPNHPDLASSYNSIGGVYASMGDYSKALSYYEKALAIREQSLPPNHPDLDGSYNNIGMVNDNMGNYPKALSYYEKALAIREQSLPPNHLDLCASYHNIGTVYYNIGDYRKALSSHEKALEIQEQSMPLNYSNLTKLYIAHSVLLNQIKEHSKAINFYEKAFDMQRQTFLHYYPKSVTFGTPSIGPHTTLHDHFKAFLFWQLAVHIAEYSLPSKHPHLQWCKNKLNR